MTVLDLAWEVRARGTSCQLQVCERVYGCPSDCSMELPLLLWWARMQTGARFPGFKSQFCR